MREGLLVAGKYKLLKLIGSGGMGAVWLSRNEMTDREFAIKFLHPSAAANPKVLTRFLQEAKVSGRLRHPSILEIFDVGIAPELEGAPFLVMELLDGAPLDMAIRLLGGLPLRLTLQISLAMSRALAVAHDKGVVHRDLKPANVFLHRTAHGGILPKLLDFGISKLSPLDTSGDSGMGLTQTGAVLGSPLYMSPEQAAGDKHVDGRSDIHALGVLLWWCIVGKSPFKSTTYNTLVVEIITGERPRLQDVMPDLPAGVSDLVSKAFARRREDRFENTTKLGDALEALLTAQGPGPSLDSREWVEEIFTRLRVTMGGSLNAQQIGPATKEASTTGAVSVSLDDIIQQDPARSPVAYTMDSKSAIALAPTEGALPTSSSGAGSVQVQTMHSGIGQTSNRKIGAYVGFGALGLVLAAAIGIGGVMLTRRGPETQAPGSAAAASPPAATSNVPAAGSQAPSTRTTEAANPPLASAAPSSSTATIGDNAAALAASPPPALVAAHTQTHGTVAKPPPPPPQTRPTGRPGPTAAPTATDPFHGISNPGFP